MTVRHEQHFGCPRFKRGNDGPSNDSDLRAIRGMRCWGHQTTDVFTRIGVDNNSDGAHVVINS